MKRLSLVTVVCILGSVLVNVISKRTGYSLSFGGVMPVAGIRNGIMDWDDVGMRNLNTRFTISYWAKFHRGKSSGSPFCLATTHETGICADMYRLMIGAQWMGFENLMDSLGRQIHPLTDRNVWNYFTVVFDHGTITLYRNATKQYVLPMVAWGYWAVPYTMQQEGSTLVLGARLITSAPIASVPLGTLDAFEFTGTFGGFLGNLDEFTIWSRALSDSEIYDLMRFPVNISKAHPDPDLVIHYNFDVLGCAELDPGASLYQEPCDITGKGIVTNHGIAGSKYDLLLGQLNDDLGYGKKWRTLDDVKTIPTLFSFDKPTISLDSPERFDGPDGDDFNIPTPVQLLPGASVELPIPRNFQPYQVLTVPTIGYLTRGSDNTPLKAGDSISDQVALYYFSANSFALFKDPFMFKIISLTGTHEFHIWPYIAPTVLHMTPRYADYVIESQVGAGKVLKAAVKPYAISPTGEQLNVRVIMRPKWIQMIQLAFVESVWNGNTRGILHDSHYLSGNNDTMEAELGLVFYLLINPEGGGSDLFQFEYYSSKSHLKSHPLWFHFDIVKTDHLPESFGNSSATVKEDSAAGLNITLHGIDREQVFGKILAIHKLPTHGTLYKLNTEEQWVRIDREYSTFDKGAGYIEQYVSKIRRVSSFMLRPGSVDMHPMNLIGPPNCQEANLAANQCDHVGIDENGALYPPESIVYFEANSPKSPLYDGTGNSNVLVSRVLAYNLTTHRLDLEIMPMYKYLNSRRVRCYLKGVSLGRTWSEFPENCDPSAVSDMNSPLVVEDIPASSPYLTPSTHRYWSPYLVGFQNVHLEDDTYTGIYGDEYIFRHNQVNFYLGDEVPAYTEYVEVEFEKSVYPLIVETGSPYGGGGIVNIKALNPNGDWVSLIHLQPQREKAKRYSNIEQYFILHERVCQQNFKTNVLRLELDTSTNTGIGSRNTIDYIKLKGAEELPPGMLHFEETLVKYVPDKDMFGEDKFSFQTYDCGGQMLRGSNIADIDISIVNVPDKPQLTTYVESPYLVCSDSMIVADVPSEKVVTSSVTFEAYDVDNEVVRVSVASQPKWGILLQNGVMLETGATVQTNRSSGRKYRAAIDIQLNCSSQGLISESLNFTINITDENGHSFIESLEFQALKTRRLRASSAIYAGWMFFATNATLCIVGLLWVVKYRENPIVKAAQVEFLCLILLGTLFSSLTILAMLVDDGENGENIEFAHVACRAIPWLYSIGFMFSFTSLSAKLYKVAHLFRTTFALSYSQATGAEKQKLRRMISFKGLFTKSMLVMSVDLWICFFWTIMHPMKFTRESIRQHELIPEFVVENVGSCGGEHTNTYLAVLGSYHCIVLMYVSLYCYKTQHINDAFSEAKYLRIAIISSLQVLLLGIPIMFITSTSDPDTHIFVKTGIIWLNDFSVTLFVFAPKLRMMTVGVGDEGVGHEHIKHAVEETERKRLSKLNNSRNSKVVPSSETTGVAGETTGETTESQSESQGINPRP